MRINNAFVGLTDIASLIGEYTLGFEANGVSVTSAIHKKTHVAQRSTPTYDLSVVKRPVFRGMRPRALQTYLQDHFYTYKNKIFKKIFNESDVFVYIDSTFYGDYSDLVKIKKSGKKIISIFTGDDCRVYEAMKQEFNHYGMQVVDYPANYDFSLSAAEGRLRYLRTCEKYADLIFSLPNQAQLALRPYFAWRLPIALNNVKENPEQRPIPKIVHAPTSREFKGTKYILSAINRLMQEGIEFEFELVEGLPNDLALKKYLESDIIISQVMCPSGGRLALEGLAMGKVVLSKMGFDNGYDEKFPQPCPIIDVSPSTIYSVLKKVVTDLEFRKKRSHEGRPYIANHFDSTKVVARILQLLEERPSVYDFYPTFFKDHFVAHSQDALEVYNRWNSYVKNCDWYKPHVGNYSRSGLFF